MRTVRQQVRWRAVSEDSEEEGTGNLVVQTEAAGGVWGSAEEGAWR